MFYALTRTSRAMLNKSGENRRLCFVPNLRGKAFGLSCFGVMLTVGFLQMPFIRLRKFPSVPSLVRVLSGMDVLHQWR